MILTDGGRLTGKQAVDRAVARHAARAMGVSTPSGGGAVLQPSYGGAKKKLKKEKKP